MIAVVVVGVVVLLLALRGQGGPGLFDGLLGRPPAIGGADGSPQAQKAANFSQTTTVGNSEQNLAHGFESAIGGIGGAAVCTYYGAGAAAPICSAAGKYLGPKAVQLGNYTTIKTAQASFAGINIGNAIAYKSASIGTNIADKGASLADRAYSGVGSLPGPLGILGKASVLPVKIVADAGASAAHAVQTGVGALESGAKSAGHAIVGTVKNVLGFL